MPTELTRSLNGKRLPALKSKSTVKSKLSKEIRIGDQEKIFAKLEEKEKIEGEGAAGG